MGPGLKVCRARTGRPCSFGQRRVRANQFGPNPNPRTGQPAASGIGTLISGAGCITLSWARSPD
jgi:hypothetical protein